MIKANDGWWRWAPIFMLGLLNNGCVIGKSQFKVVQEPTHQVAAAEAPALLSTPTPVSAPTPLETQTYQVVAGDTLWDISRRLAGSPWRFQALAAYNRLVNPDLLYPGQALKIPLEWGPNSAAQDTAPKGASPNPIKPTSPPQGGADRLFPKRDNRAFAPGERLFFSVEYFGIAAGLATMEVLPGPELHGRETYHLRATARTHPAFEWMFKVEDRIESYMDRAGLFSWHYEKHIREGGYKNDTVITYDQLNRRIIMGKNKTVFPAPAWTQDVLSEFYYFRTLPLVVGGTLSIPVVADDGKTYELLVKVLRREKKTVPAGAFDCLVVEPYLKFEGLFRHQGQLHIWVTDDERKVPVFIQSRIVIGSIDIVLRDAVVVTAQGSAP